MALRARRRRDHHRADRALHAAADAQGDVRHDGGGAAAVVGGGRRALQVLLAVVVAALPRQRHEAPLARARVVAPVALRAPRRERRRRRAHREADALEQREQRVAAREAALVEEVALARALAAADLHEPQELRDGEERVADLLEAERVDAARPLAGARDGVPEALLEVDGRLQQRAAVARDDRGVLGHRDRRAALLLLAALARRALVLGDRRAEHRADGGDAGGEHRGELGLEQQAHRVAELGAARRRAAAAAGDAALLAVREAAAAAATAC